MQLDWMIELVRDGLRNLVRHRVRSTLTLLGVVFGIASVTTMIAVGEGAQRTVLREIEALGLKNIIMDSVKPTEVETARAGQQTSRSILGYGITEVDARQIAAISPESSVSVAHRVNQKIYSEGARVDADVLGVAPQYFNLFGSELLAGMRLAEMHEMLRHTVAVVTPDVAASLRGIGGAVGKEIKIGPKYFRVIGVMSVPGRTAGGTVFLPYATARAMFGTSTYKWESGSFEATRTEIGRLVVHTEHEDAVPGLAQAVARVLEMNHQTEDVSVTVPLDVLRSKQRTQRVFNIVLITIAAISLFVGGIGIMNIMLAIVMERTREIGIRRAVGARKQDVFMQFLVETVTLSSVGGALGVILGIVMMPIAASWTGWESVLTPWAVIAALVVSWTVGVVFGTAPAIRAARLDPVDALRYE
ncbi:MAG: ABC transporter permease [Verrucomicrobia bacterium]|nr:ABC transporter permease [Verrucomicrobiota bacterium]MDA1087174.1 ABC transporter permease [Verrucomicrobiota bacterium]